MAEVEVIKAVDGPILRKRDYEGNPLVIKRELRRMYVSARMMMNSLRVFSLRRSIIRKRFQKIKTGYSRHLCG